MSTERTVISDSQREIINARPSSRAKALFRAARIAFPLAIVCAIWAPEFLHFHVDHSLVSTEAMASSLQTPNAEVLDEIARMDLAVDIGVPDTDAVSAANGIILGRLQAPAFLKAPMALKGYPEDFQRGPPTFQLAMASMRVESILLRAYEITRDQSFLNLAVTRVLAFDAYEAGRYLGEGFLWNDHAIAARISTLTRLWRHVRQRPEVSAESRRAILSLVARSGRLLAKPDHFTVRTNHGVMQNIALLQIGAAFPALPEAAAWRALAIDRLRIQLPFYVSSEGFVLEHSAGYHLLGTELLAMTVRLSVLNGLTPDPELVAALNSARTVLSYLMRPDESLPLVGDTGRGEFQGIPLRGNNATLAELMPVPPGSAPRNESRIFPVSGYALWWTAEPTDSVQAQTVIAWAKHDGHGHKHADDASVLFWSGGIEWITNTGYWPYGDRLGEAASSWSASNAPHEIGEAANSLRSVELINSGSDAEVKFLDLERRIANGGRIRRQVVQIGPDLLAVLDFSSKVSNGTETVWTITPPLDLLPTGSGNEFVSTPAPDGRRMVFGLAVPSTANAGLHRGSERPFAGWVVLSGKPTPADAVVVSQPTVDSVTAAVFRVAAASENTTQTVEMDAASTPERWKLSVLAGDTATTVSREGSSVEVYLDRSAPGSKPAPLAHVSLDGAPNVDIEKAKLKQAFLRAVSAYPQWHELAPYRLKVSYLIVVLGLLGEIAWYALSRLIAGMTRRQYVQWHIAIASGWLCIAVWTLGFYLHN